MQISLNRGLDTLRSSHSLRLVTRIIVIILVASLFLYLWILNRSRLALKDLIRYNAPYFSELFLKDLDSQIENRLNFWQTFSTQVDVEKALVDSNFEFDHLSNPKDIISQRDVLWTQSQIALSQEKWYQSIVNNDPSKRITQLLNQDNNSNYSHLGAAEVFITNKYGAIVLLGSTTTDYDQSDEKWWQEAVKNGFSIQNIEYDQSSNKSGIPIGIRISDNNGQFIGVLKLIIDMDRISQYLKKDIEDRIIFAGQRTGLYGAKLVDSEGNLIFSLGPQKYSQEYQKLVRSLISDQKITSSYKLSSSQNMTILSIANSEGYLEYPGLGWHLILENDQSILFSPISSVIKGVIIIIGLSFFAIILVGLQNAYVTNKIITDISEIANDLANGNYKVRVNLKDGDELVKLANNFNHMAQKLEEGQKIRDDFISVAVHQLRSPVVAARWTIELLTEKEPLSDTVKTRLNDVRVVMMQLGNTISDLLRVFKLENITKALEKSSVNVQEILNKQVVEIEPIVQKKSLVVRLDLPPQPIFINLNADMFKEVVNNLISNSAKYSFQNGYIDIKLSLIGDQIQLQVSDKGIGIPSVDQKNIFDKFFRASNAQSQKIEGSGLGLYIAKENALRLGGNISFVSRENEGTTFIFTLPTTS